MHLLGQNRAVVVVGDAERYFVADKKLDKKAGLILKGSIVRTGSDSASGVVGHLDSDSWGPLAYPAAVGHNDEQTTANSVPTDYAKSHLAKSCVFLQVQFKTITVRVCITRYIVKHRYLLRRYYLVFLQQFLDAAVFCFPVHPHPIKL